MNFLGHLYLSGNQPKLMLANLFGDFVKGRDYTYLPQIVQNGVALHRHIDDYFDFHPKVLELRLNLYDELPKVAGIAIDLYFDHLLAKNWNHFHSYPLDKYVDNFFDFALNPKNYEFKENQFKYSEEFIYLLNMMEKHNWLTRYAQIEGLKMASEGLSKRISFQNNLNEASGIYLKYETSIKKVFDNYMQDAKIEFNL